MNRAFLLPLMLAAMLPITALAQEVDYDGVYNVACTKETAEFVITIADGAINYYEGVCTLTNPEPVRGLNATLFDAACMGEGQEWTKRLMIMAGIEPGSIVLVEEGYADVFARCE